MKSLVRWGTTLGLVGSTVLTTVFSGIIPAFALSEQQIKEKLDAVPVWMITNPQGLPLSRQLPAANDGKKKAGSVTGVYLSKAEAQAFIKELQGVKNPDPKMAEMLKTLQATAVPLGSIYQQLQQTKNQTERLQFAFKPVEQELKGAVDLLRASGQDVKQFPSVPVFMVRFAPDKGYVPIQLGSDKKEYFPLFMSKQDALALLNQVKSKFPKADIQVVDVDGVLKTMQDKNDKWLEQVVFFPSPEAREYIRTLSSNNPQQKPNQQPANRPAAPKK
ncbi:Tic22 family protein [Calothrix sp. NIES-4071]|nr:Tic22 family protein [Calothrix sp. NIES-4071]BAZ60560.1 Tic22 family protein [Calothrix sp. NIES-4105]